jgi:hypothetical protein
LVKTTAGRLLAGLLLLASATADARPMDVFDHAAVMESLSSIHPRLRGRWLAERDIDLPGWNAPLPPAAVDSGGLRLVGKYGRGPAREVTGTDSLLLLSNGSEVAVFSIADPARPRLLCEIQASSVVAQAAAVGRTLVVGDLAEVSTWDISDPTHPVRLSVIPHGVADFAVSDSLLAFTSQGTFRVYSIAAPTQPRQLGMLPDSGTVRAASGSSFLLSSNRDIIYIIDCSDPARPVRRGSYPGYVYGLAARGNICCVAVWWYSGGEHFRFDALDITDPDNIRRIGQLSEVGGYDIHLDGNLVFVSGYQSSGFEFTIVSLADSTNPTVIGRCTTPGDNDGVWSRAASGRAYVADRFRGLAIVDASNPASPVVDTSLHCGGSSVDIAIDGTLACVASDGYGMVLLDVSNPAQPVHLGALDSTRKLNTRAVAVADSFAYMGYSPSLGDLHTVDISNPTRPTRAGGETLFNWPEDIVVRDSLAYLAEVRRFEVVNVARPREPRLVGSCVSGDAIRVSLCLVGPYAYVGNWRTQVVDVRNPLDPQVVAEFVRASGNVSVRDTCAFISAGKVIAYSVARPTLPVALDSIDLGSYTSWVQAIDTLLYTVNDDGVHVVDASDVRHMREVGFAATPYAVYRLRYVAPYIYATCWDAAWPSTNRRRPASARRGQGRG